MKDKIQKAIFNNNDLYEEIFSGHPINFRRTDAVCYCLEKTPPLYSNLVTISNTWRPDENFTKIDFNYENEKWDEWSIKDSFSVLDLSEFGFETLFDAQWIYLEAEKFTPTVNNKRFRYEIVKTTSVLSEWRIAWDADEQLGKKIFKPELLDNPRVYFIAGYEAKKLISGCFINRTKEVLGLSNFFAPVKNCHYLSDMIGFIYNSIERADIVGYERKEFVRELQVLGFEATGALTVWLKKRGIK